LWSAVAAIAALLYAATRWWYDELRLLDRGALIPLFDNRVMHSRVVHQLYDATAVVASFLTVRMLMPMPLTGLSGRVGSLGSGAIVSVVSVGAFLLAGLYRGSYMRAGVPELLRIARAVVIGVIISGFVWTVVFSGGWPVTAWLLHFYLVLTAIVSARLLFRVLDHVHQRAQRIARRVLIVGAGRGGELAVREMLSNTGLGLVPVGFVDDDLRLHGSQVHGYLVYGGTEVLERTLAITRADQVVLSTRKLDAERFAAVAAACARRGVPLVQLGMSWQTLDIVGPASGM